MGIVCGRCLPFWPFFRQVAEDQQPALVPNQVRSGEDQQRPRVPNEEPIRSDQNQEGPEQLEEDQQRPQGPNEEQSDHNQEGPEQLEEDQQRPPGPNEEQSDQNQEGPGRVRFGFKIRGRELGLELPAECTQVESGDHKLAVFEAGPREFDGLLAELLRFENPELCLVPILENRRLVVQIPADPKEDSVASDLILQVAAAQKRFGLEQKWILNSPGMLYVYRESRNQFLPGVDVTDRTEAFAADRALQVPGSEALVYYDLPMLLALEEMAESDDPGDVDRKCREMVRTGVARIAVGLFAWDPAKPGEMDGTVKVYQRNTKSRSKAKATVSAPDWEVAVKKYRRPRYFELDSLHTGMRLYLPNEEGYGWPVNSKTPDVSWEWPLDACCDVQQPEVVKRAINIVESLNMEDSNGRLCMVEAAKAGDVSLLDYMHQHGASVDGEDAEGVSPYVAARAHQRAEACKWLEERGCGLHNPQSALEQAIQSGKKRAVEYLLLAGESKQFAGEEGSCWSTGTLARSLVTAKNAGNGEAVKMLEDKLRDRENIKRLLDKAKADQEDASQTVSWRPQSLQLCLSSAINVSNGKLVKSLLSRGCKPTVQDHYQAAACSDPSILEQLLETKSISGDKLSTFHKDLEKLKAAQAQKSPSPVAGAAPAV